ncbi:hypothetical protein K458DRAFT_492296 [Lentithecium fluviatile CBS 122367]|uniref:F-box domain-containing protein n=1 Tax=Lentithecium fluviatile CBS 122367 TaxID=1168545 RepID=A0A6G1IFU1_9PLEO|nr:hypothetical protein K458DRAFT_492296 [Lentithecium fluviatile CBS 122367]
MANIAQLPNEILLDIFECLQDEPFFLVNIVSTCRRWYRLGCSTLYRHISLRSKLRGESTATRFAKSAAQRDLVQSLGLQVTQAHLMGLSVLSGYAFDRLIELGDVVASMENLQTVALSFEKPHGHGFTAPAFAIVSLLHSLPKTVVNLSLDCECMSSPELKQPHICDAVGALLPRLRSLRLQTSHLCSGLLSRISPQATLDHERPNFPIVTTRIRATSSLEYLLVRLVMRPESECGPHTLLCYSENRPIQDTRLSTALHDLQKAGAFPLLRHFAVMGRVDAQPTPQNNNWNVFKVRSLAGCGTTTTTLPWCARGGSSSLYMIRDDEGDWFGSFQEITTALEGPLAWTTTGIKGNPPSLRDTIISWPIGHSKLASRDSVIKMFGVSFRLWKHEDAAKMKLLHSRTAAGFDDTAASSQTLPPGWRWEKPIQRAFTWEDSSREADKMPFLHRYQAFDNARLRDVREPTGYGPNVICMFWHMSSAGFRRPSFKYQAIRLQRPIEPSQEVD